MKTIVYIMKTIVYNNILFSVGQNAQDNWNMLEQLEKINSNYIWFHLNSFPSCYVIMHKYIRRFERC